MADSLAPEFSLLAAACGWPHDAARCAVIRTRAAAVEDWPHFARLVKRHRVAGLVQRGLNAANVLVPAGIALGLSQDARNVAVRGILLAGESIDLQARFDRAGIATRFLKGASLEKLAYGEIGIKSAWDIDLLVGPEDVSRVAACVLEAGYRRVRPPESFDERRFALWIAATREAVFARRDRGIHLEVHWRASENPLLIPGISAHSPCRSVALTRDGSLRTLADADLFAYLCVHGATHGWSRLKWLADLAAWLAAKSPAEVAALYRQSQELGAGRCSGQALLLCERLFDFPLHPEIAAELKRDRKTRTLVAAALHAMAGGGEKELEDRVLGDFFVLTSAFLFRDGWRYLWTTWTSAMIGATDIARFPLPRYLYFLYPLMRIPSWAWRVIRRGGKGPLRPPLHP